VVLPAASGRPKTDRLDARRYAGGPGPGIAAGRRSEVDKTPEGMMPSAHHARLIRTTWTASPSSTASSVRSRTTSPPPWKRSPLSAAWTPPTSRPRPRAAKPRRIRRPILSVSITGTAVYRGQPIRDSAAPTEKTGTCVVTPLKVTETRFPHLLVSTALRCSPRLAVTQTNREPVR